MDTKRIRNVDISQIHHLSMIDFIGNDFAIFDDIKDMPLSSYPTRLNAACLTVCLKGWCKLELNLQQCEMREGMLGVILPDQIVLQRERSEDFSGLFIAVSKDFMDMVIPTMQQLFPMFFMIKERPFVQITPEESQSFQEYHSFLWSKVKLKDNPFRKEITQGLLLALFMRYIISIKDMFLRNVFPRAERKTCSSALFVPFQSPTRKSAVCLTMPIRCSSPPSTFLP